MRRQGSHHSSFLRPIIIQYRPPVWLFYVIVLLYALAIYGVLISAILLELKIILIILISIGFYRESIDHNNYTPELLTLDFNGNWKTKTAGDQEANIRLVSVGFYTPTLIVLGFKDEELKMHTYVLTNNCVDDDTLRRLRVRLLQPINEQ